MSRDIDLYGHRVSIDESTGVGKKMWERIARQEWEPYTFAALDRWLDPRRSFVDVGAYAGSVTMYAAFTAARVFAYEADPLAFEVLQANLGLNVAVAARVTAERRIVRGPGTPSGERTLYAGNKWGRSISSIVQPHGYSASSHKSAQTPTIDVTTDAGIARHPPAIIKYDVEGGEVELICGLGSFLARHRCVLLLELHWRKMPKLRVSAMLRELRAFPYLYGGIYRLCDHRYSSPAVYKPTTIEEIAEAQSTTVAGTWEPWE